MSKEAPINCQFRYQTYTKFQRMLKERLLTNKQGVESFAEDYLCNNQFSTTESDSAITFVLLLFYESFSCIKKSALQIFNSSQEQCFINADSPCFHATSAKSRQFRLQKAHSY